MSDKAAEGAALRPLVFTRYPTKASWKETFYDGETKVVEGRITYYKPNWVMELMANRGFTYEPEPQTEMPEAEASVAAQTSGQEPATDKPKRPRRSKSEVNNGN